MGNNPSVYTQQYESYNGNVTNSDEIRRNIMKVFKEKKSSNYNDFETIGWNNTNKQFGGQNRNRYEQYNPETLINQLIAQNNLAKQNTNQLGGNIKSYDNDENNYKEMTEDVLSILRKNIVAQTGGADCPCTDNQNYSETSDNPVDYKCLKGGKRDDNNKKHKNNEDEENEDEDEDEEEEEDNEEEEEEEEEEDNDNDDNDDDDDDEDEEEIADMERAKRGKKSRKHHRIYDGNLDDEDKEEDDEDEENDDENDDNDDISEMSESSNDISKVIQPFYSSDSDHYNISRRRMRF